MNTTQSTSRVIYKGDPLTNLAMGRCGKMQRKAFYSLCYGASIRTAVKASGLSLRRVKVIAKQLPTL